MSRQRLPLWRLAYRRAADRLPMLRAAALGARAAREALRPAVSGVPGDDIVSPITVEEEPLPPPPSARLRDTGRRVLFVSAEPSTPGHIYRCEHQAEAVRMAGHEARIIALGDVGPDSVAWAEVLVLWRVAYSTHVHTMLDLARNRPAPAHVVFDVDDLIVLPELARPHIIDGIRTNSADGQTESQWSHWFLDEQRTLSASDAAFSTTRPLARALRAFRPVGLVLPNTFSPRQRDVSRVAARTRAQLPGDGLFRIGYAAGTRSHQRDFAVAAPAIAAVLRDVAHARLVLFRAVSGDAPLLLLEEFPAFEGLERQIEWRVSVPFDEFARELARFDVSIAPLDIGNPFCEAKSEIKYTEAALCDVPCIASATETFREAIRHGETGLLATSSEEWEAALRGLIADPGRARALGRAARWHVLAHYGIERQARALHTYLAGLSSERAAADSAELLLRRAADPAWRAPDVPSHHVLYACDQLGQAAVSVVVTCYNYARFVREALESVAAQTLTALDLIVVDDGSQDGAPEVIVAWCEDNRSRFNRVVVLQSDRNCGLGGARNIGMNAVETAYAMQLDADNVLLPLACERLLSTIRAHHAAYAYPVIKQVGGREVTWLGRSRVGPLGFVGANSVDAMAMVATWAWAAVGGYYVRRDAMGWEDYDLWCCFAEQGLHGVHHSEILAHYRLHGTAMTNDVTERAEHKQRVVAHVGARHPWLSLFDEAARQRDL
ncbi:glycosyltransferase [Ameyamaea chiangmaiensis]|uniref:Glycosyltransferase n=1 Tax=Ameyamaea chiangmaiensis TaxID=442969 RepID=A0A850P785_9PROT|nr:glycosyltransferase [Ameyamaea chiangmaiensis]MBS4075950.1 glycosyltransferase [Ameyamaea chiangmaiensis]NVN39764.1 glycosyltransferase [Ameyamaea chiangmaiensis]